MTSGASGILTLIDEASRECLALIMARQRKHENILTALADLFIARGPPAHIRSTITAQLKTLHSPFVVRRNSRSGGRGSPATKAMRGVVLSELLTGPARRRSAASTGGFVRAAEALKQAMARRWGPVSVSARPARIVARL